MFIITLKKKLELIEHELCINNSGEPLALDSMQISIQWFLLEKSGIYSKKNSDSNYDQVCLNN